MAIPGITGCIYKIQSVSNAITQSFPLTDIIGVRASNTSLTAYRDGTTLSTTLTNDSAGAVVALALNFGSDNFNGTPENYTRFREQISWWGSSLTTTNKNNMRTRIATFKSDYGR